MTTTWNWRTVMNGLYAGVTTGWQSGMAAARRVFEDPAQAYQQSFISQQSKYNLLWSYYNNSIFDKAATSAWTAYKTNYNLYRNIRSLYNPTRRLVDFHASAIYPGVLSEDGLSFPDGSPSAIPFSKDTPEQLVNAVAQIWRWSNWQAKKSVEIRYGAALGDVLVEVVDDLQRGKVTLDVIWPGFIYDLDLDAAGNIKAYILEYSTCGDEGAYIFRKEVDQEVFRYYRNGELYDYTGDGAIVENPYGFVPAVWAKHRDIGGDHGDSAIAGSQGKIDELNALVSHIHDQVHKVIGAPVVLWGAGAIGSLTGQEKRGATDGYNRDPQTAYDQEQTLMLKGPAGGHLESLAGNLDMAGADISVGRLMTEIEADNPELTLYRELRAMSQVTGPAASRLIGDVTSRIQEAQANYDRANISLWQMAVAIAGYRATSGAWGPALSRAQQKFLSFGLDSYAAGDLDMSIAPRPLLTPTKLEQAQENQAMWGSVSLAVQAGAPLEAVLRDEGWTDEQLAQLGADKLAQIQRDQALANEDVVPQVQQ